MSELLLALSCFLLVCTIEQTYRQLWQANTKDDDRVRSFDLRRGRPSVKNLYALVETL